MRILHLSTSDVGGGAARAAFRLHTGLRRLGHDSTMLVLKRTSGESSVAQLKWSNNLATRLRRKRRRKQIARDFEPYKKSLPAGFEIFSDDRSDAGYDLVKQLPPCDLINLHWVAGLIDHEIFFDNLPARVPLPSKITIRVLKPVDLRKRLGKDPDPREGYKLVTGTMQRSLTQLARHRSVPVVQMSSPFDGD